MITRHSRTDLPSQQSRPGVALSIFDQKKAAGKGRDETEKRSTRFGVVGTRFDNFKLRNISWLRKGRLESRGQMNSKQTIKLSGKGWRLRHGRADSAKETVELAVRIEVAQRLGG